MKKILIIASLFLLVSCGSRKTEKSNTEQKSEIYIKSETSDKSITQDKSELNTKTTTSKEVNEITGEIIETTTDEPIDATKPASVIDKDGNKTDLNNAKRTKQKRTILSDKKIKVDNTTEQSKKEAKNELKNVNSAVIIDKKESKKENNKKTDKKESYLWVFWLFLLVFIARAIYCIKKKTPFI